MFFLFYFLEWKTIQYVKVQTDVYNSVCHWVQETGYKSVHTKNRVQAHWVKVLTAKPEFSPGDPHGRGTKTKAAPVNCPLTSTCRY